MSLMISDHLAYREENSDFLLHCKNVAKLVVYTLYILDWKIIAYRDEKCNNYHIKNYFINRDSLQLEFSKCQISILRL